MRARIKTLALLICLALASPLHAEGPATEIDEEQVLYALGLALSQNLMGFSLTADELTRVQAGLTDGVLGREPKVDLQQIGPQIQTLLRARMAATADKEKAAGDAFRAEAAKEPGAVVKDSGLVYLEIQAGSGASPAATDTVKLHYHGTLRDGQVFDSSVERGEPATFSLQRVVPCFREGLTLMKVGGKSKIACPPDLAYGERGSPPKILPGATINFELELLEIVGQPAATPAP
jgi:FKBP-type peptidyl-prolyl cis-trans isomerase FkpA/FKBP-type peptidyl-prolyl cis-trans isomerase FklB